MPLAILSRFKAVGFWVFVLLRSSSIHTLYPSFSKLKMHCQPDFKPKMSKNFQTQTRIHKKIGSRPKLGPKFFMNYEKNISIIFFYLIIIYEIYGNKTRCKLEDIFFFIIFYIFFVNVHGLNSYLLFIEKHRVKFALVKVLGPDPKPHPKTLRTHSLKVCC